MRAALISAFLILVAILIIALALTRKNLRKESPSISNDEVERVKIVILVDNNAGEPGLRTAWGFSAFIEADGKKILFDTGPDPSTLKHNCQVLGINLSELDLVVLSHEHGDHTGGMAYVKEVAPGIPVYIPSNSPYLLDRLKKMGFDVRISEDPTELAPGIITTGSMRGPPMEQGLIIRVKGLGSILLTGCAHPGIETMALRTSNLTGKVFAVMGGFHLIGASKHRLEGIKKVFLELKVDKVFPMHCSGNTARAFFKKEMPNAYGDGHVGLAVEFSEGRSP